MLRDRRCRRSIDTLGAISLLALACGTAASLFLAATQPPLDASASKHGWFADLQRLAPWLPPPLRDALRGAGPLATGRGFIVAYCAPLLISTFCGLLLLLALRRYRDDLREHDARRILAWAIAFTVVAVPAFNVLTQDIWLSVAWGRMLNHGMNPFAGAYPIEFAADLPLEYDPMPMTYGPLWAVVCSAAVVVGGGAPVASWLALKLVLGCAWITCLWAVFDIARPLGAWRAALAVAITGWLPLGVHCGVAEGHNDVVMVAAALLWTRTMLRTSSVGPIFLSLSILIKYVTAPLALVDLIYHRRAATMSVRCYMRRVALAALLLLAAAAIVVSSSRGIGLTSAMHSWKFLDPADVFRLLDRYPGLHAAGSSGLLVVAITFGSVALNELVRLARNPTAETAQRAQLAIMAVVLLACTGHVWPWFFVWALPFAALVPSFWLSRFVIGAATVAPFVIVHWWRFGVGGALRSELPSLVMYGAALAATVFHAAHGTASSSGLEPELIDRVR